MKKRSMLALASLATGFVVAAITPSHAADKGPLDGLDVSGTLHSAGDLVSHDSLAPADSPATGHTGHTTGHAPGLAAGQD